MYCPRCGERQPLGSRRCAACGFPFTREEAASGRAAARSGAVPGAVRYREWERGPGVGRRVLGCLGVTILGAVVVLGVITILSNAVVRPYIGRAIAAHIRLPVASTPVSSGQAAAPTPDAAGGLIPSVPANAAQVVITEDELNSSIATHASEIRPLDSATVRITPTEVAVDMSAYGVSGTYHGQVVVQNGKAVLTNGRIDGPLGWVVSPGPIESALNDQIAASLDASGVSVTSVALQQGQMTVGLAPH